MDETVSEVLYETRHHATRDFPSDFSKEQVDGGVKGGLFSLLSFRGIYQLKEKWDKYKRPRVLKRCISLFISPSGERVAVTSGNQITILQKDDCYMEPCGIFTSSDRLTLFTHGAWSDTYDILGVIDDMDTLYFIKSNGEEITRVTKRQLKTSAPIIGLIMQDDPNAERSCFFSILTSDGLLYHIEFGQPLSPLISTMLVSSTRLALKQQFHQNVACLDFYPKLSLLVLVGSAGGASENTNDNSGFYCLSLWRIKGNSNLELLFCSPHFEGLFYTPKNYVGPSVSAKVCVSPQGKYVAALDLTGTLDILKLDDERCSLSSIAFGERSCSQMSDNLLPERRRNLKDILDFTWWSDCTLILANRSGVVTMLDVHSGTKLLQNDLIFSMPILERCQQCQGFVFLLENTSYEDRHSIVSSVHGENITHGNYNQLHSGRLYWHLISFLERSVPEMYTILISNQRYRDALNLSNRHGLDRDGVFKSQWLHSDKETDDIKMFLSNIKDQNFVLAECIDRVGPSEDAVKALLSCGLRITDQYKFSESEDDHSCPVWDFRMIRLQLLQCRDRLETFVGINMGRFSEQEYSKFRIVPLNEAAVSLAESGKIGALNLLFKRHPYSLAPFILDILAAIPETVPVQTYGQLLPGRSPPNTIALRDRDWVECENMLACINRSLKNYKGGIEVKTELILKQCVGFVWPSVADLSVWYQNRVRGIDSLTGQLDNCLSMVEFACRKGIVELQRFNEDISYLYQLIYSNGCDEDISFSMSLVVWEKLTNYEKFKMMLKGVKEDTVVGRLYEKAIPFMHNWCSTTESSSSENHVKADSYLVRWLKEIASENKLDICLMVIEEGCKDFQIDGIFQDEVEAIELTLQCLYLCTLTDRWNTMASILSKLPRLGLRGKSSISDRDLSSGHVIQGSGSPRFPDGNDQVASSDRRVNLANPIKGISASGNAGGFVDLTNTVTSVESLEKRIKLAEGHVEAGRLLAYYQVPKPMSFFPTAHSDEKGVKQLLRLILSKFGRRQPGRSDNDWANMWRDMQCLQEKAFPFLDIEYMLMEFCRGLLKAGKFSLARNYLKGTSNISLATEKAENLVIQAAREYFFSASSLASTEIWKAKECLNLFPNSKNVKAEADIIDALTIKLPNLGVTLLPMQFRQIRNPMEIINMVITSQTGAYLDIDELIKIAKILGLGSQDDIATVQEAVAREAAVNGDLQLAFDLCLVLAKKGHGAIWDLCAAIARGPALDNMNISSRKQLLGFALSHCDEESIGELLHAWKDLDMQSQCEKLISLTGTDPPKFSVQGSSIISHPAHHIEDIVTLRESSKMVEGNDDQEVHLKKIKNILSTVGKDFPLENGTTWDSLLKENRNFLSFAALQLPWLLELSGKAEYGKQMTPVGKQYVSVRTQALVTSLSWLARNDITPNDDLIASLAKSIMDAPVTEGEDILGCLFLLNLVDAFHGVEIIEEQLKTRVRYQDICSIMNIGMTYSSLHNSGIECMNPAQRRKLLLQKFQEKHASFSLDTKEKIDKAQSTFWREWKLKLEEQKRLTDQCRVLEQIIPGVEPARFLSGDFKYMESAIYSFIDSVKLEKKPILKEALKLADTYGLSRTEVLLRYLGSALVSEHWENDDIKAEILHYKEEILTRAARVINMISSTVYPVIDGHNKKRLAYIYNILSDCYMQSKGTEESMLGVQCDPGHTRTLNLSQFYKVLERECRRVSFIKNLNFKNIAKLGDLNFEYFNEEVYKHINDSTVEALAEMVRTLVGIYKDSGAEGLMSWQAICKHHVSSLLATIETETKTKLQVNSDNVRALIIELENNYDRCSRYISVMSETDIFDIMGRYLALSIPYNCVESIRGDSEWVDCLILLLDLWVRLADDIQEILFHGQSDEKAPIMFNPESLSKCLKVFRKLVIEDKVSAKQGWGTVSNYAKVVLTGGFTADISIFCRAMGFSGCQFIAIAEVFAEVVTPTPNSNVNPDRIQSLPFLYASMTDSILLELGRGSSDNRSNLHLLLSSLSKLEGNLEDLKSVRYAVWGRLNAFSDNMQLQNHIRVYAMELMQSVTGKNRRGLPIEILSDVQPWEGWDEPQCITSSDAADQSVPKQSDGSSRLTSTLVALKSTQLVAAISPATEITPEDLMTIDSAVSCFLRLSKARTTELHIDVLQGVLGEWEGLFTSGKDEEESREPSDAENNWSVDDWDKEWESFQEEPGEKEGKEDGSVPVHPLHLCWMEIVKKLVEASQLAGVLKLIDGSLSRAKGIMLSENEAKTLCQLLLGTDWFLALKISLLLPYEPIRFQCLSAVEAKLKDGSILGKASRDHELLTLILSSGILSTIANDSSYSAVFSYLCYLVGNLSRLFQETQLTLVKYRPKDGSKRSKNEFFLFGRLLFPCFVSELVKAKQHLLAGFIVSQFMHTPASFGLIDVAEATLRMYLDGQIHIQQHAEPGLEEMGPCESLVNTVSSLRSKLGILVQSALSTLSTNVK